MYYNVSCSHWIKIGLCVMDISIRLKIDLLLFYYPAHNDVIFMYARSIAIICNFHILNSGYYSDVYLYYSYLMSIVFQCNYSSLFHNLDFLLQVNTICN